MEFFFVLVGCKLVVWVSSLNYGGEFSVVDVRLEKGTVRDTWMEINYGNI